jgi:CBS domain-containing protein
MTISAILKGRDGNAILTISSKDLIKQVVSVLAGKKIGAMPVVDSGAVVGIISERDVLYGLAREGDLILTRTVAEVMISPVITVEPQTTALDALSLMTRRRIRHLPVVKDAKLIGFISIGDLVKHRIDQIESEASAMRDYIQMA